MYNDINAALNWKVTCLYGTRKEEMKK